MRKVRLFRGTKNKHIAEGVFVFLCFIVFEFVIYSDPCTHPCPYRLAKLGTSLRVRGKLTLRKKEFIVFKMYKNKKYGNDSYKKAVPA